MNTQPVAFGLSSKILNQLFLPGNLKQPVQSHSDGRKTADAPLIKPADRRPQYLPLIVQADDCGALSRQSHPSNAILLIADFLPQLLTCVAETVPRSDGIFFRPARFRRRLRCQIHLGLSQQISLQVKQQGANTLSPTVDGQYERLITFVVSICHKDAPSAAAGKL